MDDITFGYRFEMEGDDSHEILVRLDRKSYRYIPNEDTEPPAWTELGFHQCENCPLSLEEHRYCPVASNISCTLSLMKDKFSCEPTSVSVTTPARTYSTQTDLQSALNSLFGLIMASSDCPHFHWLRPLARFHLPFAKLEETAFRSISICALSEIVNEQATHSMEQLLAKLRQRYEALLIINEAMIQRIQTLGSGEADKNALLIFHSYCQIFQLSLETRSVDEITAYLYSSLKQQLN